MTNPIELSDGVLEAVTGGGATCPSKPKLREKNPYEVKTTTRDTSNSSGS